MVALKKSFPPTVVDAKFSAVSLWIPGATLRTLARWSQMAVGLGLINEALNFANTGIVQ